MVAVAEADLEDVGEREPIAVEHEVVDGIGGRGEDPKRLGRVGVGARMNP